MSQTDSLVPTLPPETEELLAQSYQLFTISDKEQRPLAISLPGAVTRALARFQAVADQAGLSMTIMAAHKATDRLAALRALSGQAGVDVASPHELANARAAGFMGSQLVASGPKSDQFLGQLLQTPGVTIAVDSLGELQRLVALQASGPKVEQPQAVLLRLTKSLLGTPGEADDGRHSRFGLDAPAYRAARQLLQDTPSLYLRGLALHIDSRSLDEKVGAVRQAIAHLSDLQASGHAQAAVLDIGGGWGSAYGLAQGQYARFDEQARAMVLAGAEVDGAGLTTWNRHSYGLHSLGGRVMGGYHSVDMPEFPVGAGRLAALLASTPPGEVSTIAQLLDEQLIDLWIEPGSALFEEAGTVVARVIDVCQRDGHTCVVVDAHRDQISFFGNEVISDPILVPRQPHPQTARAACPCFVFGILCMESDLMSYRQVQLPAPPRPGDLLAWTHTGAYRMHMSQSNAIGHPDMASYTYQHATLTKEAA